MLPRCRYLNSISRYGQSPFIYPVYGLGGLPESFSRLAAINGGIFVLNRTVDEILFDADGKAWGIRGDDEVAEEPAPSPPAMRTITGSSLPLLLPPDRRPPSPYYCMAESACGPSSRRSCHLATRTCSRPRI